MESIFKGKSVLITGGTGSIGVVLAKTLVKHKPRVIRILDMDETRQFELQQEMGEEKFRFLLGNVFDKERLYRAAENIDYIFHLASLKHVLSSEYNPFEAVKTNVIGTQNIIDVAMDNEVEKLIFTSSDKAVHPCNVMGATKLLSERIVTAANYYKGPRKTVFASVRFGNVMESRGSVVPLFRKQIESGWEITVTDPNMTRFIMSKQRAAELVLKAAELAVGGEVFIFKMPAVRIGDLASAAIEEFAPRFGKDPRKIKTKLIGAKPGEKVHEWLMTEDEAKHSLETNDMFILLPEMKELLPVTAKANHPGSRKTRVLRYSSNSIAPLSKTQIRKLLLEGTA